MKYPPNRDADQAAQRTISGGYKSTTTTRQRRLAAKAEVLDHPRAAALDELAARVEADPSLWARLGAQTRIELGYRQAAMAARAELDDGPDAA
ncbi:hypothetical protein [Iamia sp.]|uniref:hypothetical protein n=1 Tax=Iamia sp. TaxID=2722710 RepID=UPI002C993CBA|nr:hypothetical protein [Iamia sp.]HXH58913.1 hypothetical protein [Iamia sp.]